MDAPTFQNIAIAIGNGLVIALLFLYKKSEKKNDDAISGYKSHADKAEARWEACEAKHEKSQTQIVNLAESVGELSGKVSAYNELYESQRHLVSLSNAVLQRLDADSGSSIPDVDRGLSIQDSPSPR